MTLLDKEIYDILNGAYKHREFCSCNKCVNELVRDTCLSEEKVRSLLLGFHENLGELGYTPARSFHEGVKFYAFLQKKGLL